MEIDAPRAGESLGTDYIAVTQNPQAESEVAEQTKVYVKFALREAD